MILNFERKNTDFKILWDHKNSISYTKNEKMKNIKSENLTSLKIPVQRYPYENIVQI